MSSYLGNAYKKLGEYEKAKNALKTSLLTYEKHYGKDHIETARILRDLAEVYLLEGDLLLAESFINKAHKIFQKSNHVDIYTVLEILAELYLKKSLSEKKEASLDQAQSYKNQAIQYLNQALEIVKNHFPEDSPHIKRISLKLEKIKKDM